MLSVPNREPVLKPSSDVALRPVTVSGADVVVLIFSVLPVADLASGAVAYLLVRTSLRDLYRVTHGSLHCGRVGVSLLSGDIAGKDSQ